MVPAAGLGAFALFFLSDYNDWKLRRRGLRLCFPLGTLLLLLGTAAGALIAVVLVSQFLIILF